MKPLLLLTILISALVFSGCTYSHDAITPAPDPSQYIKILDTHIEKDSQEQQINKNDIVVVKYQNTSSYDLENILIYVYYLDKNGQSIGTAATIIDQYMPSNKINVAKQKFFLADPQPEYIQKEWSGNLKTEVAFCSIIQKQNQSK
ncbi:hypothetical protein SEF58_10700 [Neomoorella humiferrea]|uniref:hypothetical protein n=1 Tax=Neomoorella humiferrea TaxID=676965 RepID=UPI003D8EF8CE